MKKTLLSCCEKWFYIFNAIVDGKAQAEHLFNSLKESLADFSEKAIKQGFHQADVELAVYALIALTDEVLSSKNHGAWSAQSLQLFYYGSNVAGDEFFEKLNALLSQKNRNFSVISVYYFCLQLGFKGKYYHDANALEQYKLTLSKLFVVDCAEEVAPEAKGVKALPLWLMLIVVLVIFLVVYFSFVFSMNEKLTLVRTDINTTVEQLQNVAKG